MSTKLVKKTLDIFNYKNIKNEYTKKKKKFRIFSWKLNNISIHVHTHTHTFFDRINPFTSGCVLILWINEYHRIEILAECIGSNVQLTEGWKKRKRRKVFKQLLNPKAYGTAIYALTWKTRIQRERRILCMYVYVVRDRISLEPPLYTGEKQPPKCVV